MTDNQSMAIQQAVEDALRDLNKASEETGPDGVPMLNRHVITARNRLEDALEGDYPW